MRRGTMLSTEAWLLATLGGLLALVSGCDPTIKATVEDGVITVSQSLFGAFITALIQLAGEANTTAT